MNKEVVIKLIKNQQVTQKELLEFIVDYIEFKKRPAPTAEQLQGLLQLFEMRIFNLDIPLQEVVKPLNLQVVKLFDKNNLLIKIDVYDSTEKWK